MQIQINNKNNFICYNELNNHIIDSVIMILKLTPQLMYGIIIITFFQKSIIYFYK